MLIVPLVGLSTGTMTMFATARPPPKFTLDESGRDRPEGHTVRYPPCWESATVTFNTPAATPVMGMPPRPTNCRSSVSNARRVGKDIVMRESAIRVGGSGTNVPASGDAETAGTAAGGAVAAETTEVLPASRTTAAAARPTLSQNLLVRAFLMTHPPLYAQTPGPPWSEPSGSPDRSSAASGRAHELASSSCHR